MSKPLDNCVSMPKTASWDDDDDDFMSAVREDSYTAKKFPAKNTQPSPAWSKPEPKEKRPASQTGISWGLNMTVPQAASSPSSSGSGLRFEGMSPASRTTKANPMAAFRR